MRKLLLIVLVLSSALAVGLPFAAAQDAIVLGEPIQGTLSNEVYEIRYTLEAKEDQLIGIGALPILGQDDQLDPQIQVYDSDNDLVASNDDLAYPASAVIMRIPDDDTYTIVVTRSGGKDGSSVGNFVLAVDEVVPQAVGKTVETTITSDYNQNYPSFYIMAPEDDTTITFGFEQDPKNIYASVRVVHVPDYNRYPDQSYVDSVLDMYNTSVLSAGQFTMELQGEEIYVFIVQWGGYSPDSDYSDTQSVVKLSFK